MFLRFAAAATAFLAAAQAESQIIDTESESF